jgi:hypothetical protein
MRSSRPLSGQCYLLPWKSSDSFSHQSTLSLFPSLSIYLCLSPANIRLTSACRFKDEPSSELVLRVIGALCTGEHTDNQNLIFDQPGKFSVDLISEISLYLSELYSVVDPSTVDMVIAALRALRHCAQGNLRSQKALLDRLVIDAINFFFHQIIANVPVRARVCVCVCVRE